MAQPAHLRSRRPQRDERRAQRRVDEDIVAREDFARLVATEENRRAMARIIEHCLSRHPVFSANAMEMSRNAGKQELGLWIESQLRDADPDNYLKMLAENEA